MGQYGHQSGTTEMGDNVLGYMYIMQTGVVMCGVCSGGSRHQQAHPRDDLWLATVTVALQHVLGYVLHPDWTLYNVLLSLFESAGQ